MSDDKKNSGIGAKIISVLSNPGKIVDVVKKGRKKRPDLETEYVAPRTETEKAIAEICCSLLDYEQVGVNDNLLELDAESLALAQLSARISDFSGVEVSFQAIFDSPVVSALASIVDQEKSQAK